MLAKCGKKIPRKKKKVFATYSSSCRCFLLRAVACLRGSVAGKCCVCWSSLLWWMGSTKCVWPWSRWTVAQPTGNLEIWPSCQRENIITSRTGNNTSMLVLTTKPLGCVVLNDEQMTFLWFLIFHGTCIFSGVGSVWVVLTEATCGCLSIKGFGQQRSSPRGEDISELWLADSSEGPYWKINVHLCVQLTWPPASSPEVT